MLFPRCMVVTLALSVGCVPAIAQPQQRDVQDAIAAIDRDIAAAKTETDKYSGGLVKGLIEMRLQTLQQIRAMLDQRAKSSQFGIGLRYTVDGRAYTPPWSRFAWKLIIRNKDTRPHTFRAKIEFQDKDGFVVDEDNESNLIVPPNSEQTFTGFSLVTAKVVGNVARTNAKVGLDR